MIQAPVIGSVSHPGFLSMFLDKGPFFSRIEISGDKTDHVILAPEIALVPFEDHGDPKGSSGRVDPDFVRIDEALSGQVELLVDLLGRVESDGRT